MLGLPAVSSAVEAYAVPCDGVRAKRSIVRPVRKNGGAAGFIEPPIKMHDIAMWTRVYLMFQAHSDALLGSPSWADNAVTSPSEVTACCMVG